MNIRDGAGLFEQIVEHDLADKCLRDFSFGDLKLLADLLSEHAVGHIPPYFHNGQLVFPFAAPPELKRWKRTMTDKEHYDFFRSLGVPEEEMHKYMHERAIAVARGEVDEMGRKILVDHC